MAEDYKKVRMAGGYDYKRTDRYAKMPKGEMKELKDGTQAMSQMTKKIGADGGDDQVIFDVR